MSFNIGLALALSSCQMTGKMQRPRIRTLTTCKNTVNFLVTSILWYSLSRPLKKLLRVIHIYPYQKNSYLASTKDINGRGIKKIQRMNRSKLATILISFLLPVIDKKAWQRLSINKEVREDPIGTRMVFNVLEVSIFFQTDSSNSMHLVVF